LPEVLISSTPRPPAAAICPPYGTAELTCPATFTGVETLPVAASATTSVVVIAALLVSLAQPPRVSTAVLPVPQPGSK
jgi:hypothetical protein